MIRKLKSGEYRLYSQKKNPQDRQETEPGHLLIARKGEAT
jgi:hypothetical protein